MAVILSSPAENGNGDNNNGQKVFVCKYIDKPGEGERLQTGDNPISVSVNAIPDYQGVGSYFADAQGRSYVLAEDIGQPEPDVSFCPAPPKPAWVTPTLVVTQPVCTLTDAGPMKNSGAIMHPWNDGVDYTISGGSWTNLVPGIYTVTATAKTAWYLINQPEGWTGPEGGPLTYTVTLADPLCPAWVTTTLAVTQPVCTPTATGQTVTTGAIEHPWNDGVDYTITGGSWTDLVPGVYTVTATARDGWYLMNQPDGWTPQEDGSLTYPVTIVKPADCAPAPVTPTTTPTSQVLAQGTPPTYTSQVLAAGTPPTGAATLASTGADVAPYALATLLTLLAGTGLLLLKRRSDSSDTQDTLS